MTTRNIQMIKKYREYDIFRYGNIYYAISSKKLSECMPDPDLLGGRAP